MSMYPLPERDFTGKRPVPSVKFWCVRSTLVKIVFVGADSAEGKSLDGVAIGSSSGGDVPGKVIVARDFVDL